MINPGESEPLADLNRASARFQANLDQTSPTRLIVHPDNLKPLISLLEQVPPVELRPLFGSKQGKHEKVHLTKLIGFCHRHLAFGTFRNDKVVDEKNRVITPSFKSGDECLQHPKRLCVIVVVKGRAAEIDTGVTNRLWRVIVVELILDAVAQIMNIPILQLLRRAVLDDERKVFEFLGVLSVGP
jgi:hypothetical protein